MYDYNNKSKAKKRLKSKKQIHRESELVLPCNTVCAFLIVLKVSAPKAPTRSCSRVNSTVVSTGERKE